MVGPTEVGQKTTGSVTAFSQHVQPPLPNSGQSSTPDPDSSCRNADILEKKGINSWDGISRAGDSWPESYICGLMETISHIAQRQAARVRPGERDAQTADDGPGSFCLPYIYLLPLLWYTKEIQTDKRNRLQPKSAPFHTRLGR